MNNEISATKAELANDIVSLVKTNNDLVKQMLSMQITIDNLTRSESNIREAYALVRGKNMALNSVLKDFKRSTSRSNYMKDAITASGDDNKKLKEENKALKQLFILHFKSQGLSYTKIAEFMGVSVTTVISRFKFINRILNQIDLGGIIESPK